MEDLLAGKGVASHEVNHGFDGEEHPPFKKTNYTQGYVIPINVPDNSVYSDGTPIDLCTTQRKVAQDNISSIFDKVCFDGNGKGRIGQITSKDYEGNYQYPDPADARLCTKIIADQ